MTTSKNTFCDDMRKATRGIHSISDALVNAKLAIGLFQNDVWADGLLVFYEIFSFLEQSINKENNHFLHRYQFLNELHRVQAFKDDLNFFLGPNWLKTYAVRKSVQKYLNHMHNLEMNNPTLLIAYVYHLYMGLLSGGIILTKKRQMMNKINFFDKKDTSSNNCQADGKKLTTFENKNIYELKKKIKQVTNDIADECDESTRQLLIEESKVVFILNNEIIRTVGEGKSVLSGRIFYLLIIVIIISIIYLLIM